jgi:hypothetical protein
MPDVTRVPSFRGVPYPTEEPLSKRVTGNLSASEHRRFVTVAVRMGFITAAHFTRLAVLTMIELEEAKVRPPRRRRPRTQ